MVISTLCLATTIATHQLPKEPLKVKLNQLNFMVGHWEGSRGSAWCEEIWTSAKDNIMHGSFRLHQDGKLVFSESERLVQEGENVYLRIKHFRTDFTGFETQTETTNFVVTKVGINTVTFYNGAAQGGTFLTYKRTGNTTQAWLHRDDKLPEDSEIYKFKLLN